MTLTFGDIFAILFKIICVYSFFYLRIEFLNAINIATGATLVEKLEWAFKLADSDMDGKLNMNEIVELASVFYVFRTGSSGDRMIRFLTEAQKAFFQVADQEGYVHYQDYLTTSLTHKFLYEIFL